MNTSLQSSKSVYSITVQGHLHRSWTSWFDGLQLTCTEQETGKRITIIRAEIADQAALHGLLARIRDLGLTLIAVNPAHIEEDRHDG